MTAGLAHTATHRHSGTHIELLSTIKACASEGGNLFRELIPGGSPRAAATFCGAGSRHRTCPTEVQGCIWVGSPQTQHLALYATGSLSAAPSIAARAARAAPAAGLKLVLMARGARDTAARAPARGRHSSDEATSHNQNGQ